MSKDFIRLTVDGVEVSFSATQRLLQRSPYPGGHRYELVLSDRKAVERWFHGLESTELPDSDVQWNIFYGLDRVAGEFDTEPAGEIEYLLNSIELIHVMPDSVILSGECSEVIGVVLGDR